ncbi:hypothetical protein FSP39_004798, partial [Pinctada imbricata]
DTTSTTLAAVALQDHLVRSLNLGAPLSLGPRNVGLGPAARAQKKQKKEIKSLTDTGLNKDKKLRKPVEKEKEYVLDDKPPPLTLAQKFGLVDAPEQLLSEAEWQKAKEKSNQREDSTQPCVICKEDFGTQEQACLQAFERFTGRKTCPMCRREQYQTRVIYEGSKQHRIRCATIIQATWRMYVVRSWYLKLRESVPPSDPKLRKKYYADKASHILGLFHTRIFNFKRTHQLSSITDRIVKSCDFNIDVFLTEIDQNIEASRNVFRDFDAIFQIMSDSQWDEVQLKAVQRGNSECPICLGALGSHSYIDSRTSIPKTQTVQDLYHSLSKPTEKSASGGSARVSQSQNTRSKNHSTNASHTETSGSSKARKTVLLSCSHVFHDVCLQTFEDLTLSEGRPQCPVCRSAYQKKIIAY